MKILKGILFILIICTSVIFMGGYIMSNGKSAKVQQGMNEYLNKKFEVKFEFVGKPYLTGNEGFGYKYQAKVIPVGKPELEFFVEEEDKSNAGNYIDDYLQTKWTYQGKQELDKKIKQVYGEGSDYDLRYEFRFNKEIYKNMDYSDVIKSCEGNASIAIFCDYYINGDFSKDNEAERIFEVINEFVLKYNPKYYTVCLMYIPESQKKESQQRGGDDIRFMDNLYSEGKIINYLRLEKFESYEANKNKADSISSSKDILKYFKY